MPNLVPPEPILTEDAKFAALFDLFAAYFAGTPQSLSAREHNILKAKVLHLLSVPHCKKKATRPHQIAS